MPLTRQTAKNDSGPTTGYEEETTSNEKELGDMAPVLKDILKELKELRSWRAEVNDKLGSWSEMMSASNTKDAGNNDDENEKDKTIQMLLDQMDELRSENSALKAQLNEYRNDHRKVEEEVNLIREDRNKWVQEDKQRDINFKEIMEKQKLANQTTSREFEKAVVRVVKNKEHIVRRTVEKNKCLMFFGDTEKHTVIRKDREETDMTFTHHVLDALDEEGKEWRCDIEDVMRVGKYIQGKSRPIKIQFKSKRTVEDILTVTWKLSKMEELKHIVIRRDLDKEERDAIKKLQDEAKTKNEERSEVEREQFFWRVWEMKMKKWYIKKSSDSASVREESTQEEGREG